MVPSAQGVSFPESGQDAAGVSDLRYFAGLAGQTYIASQQSKRPAGSVAVSPRAEAAKPAAAAAPAVSGKGIGTSILVALVVGVLAWFLFHSAMWAIVLAAVAAIVVSFLMARK